MKLHTVAIALVLGATALTVRAASVPDLSHAIDPGEWAYTVDPQIQLGDMQMPSKPIHNKECVTQQKLDKNKDWFTHSKPKQCTLESAKYHGNELTFTEKCMMTGSPMTVKGHLTLDSRTSYHMTVDTTGTVGGRKLQGHTKITAHRTGDCGDAKP
jgi:hypothetical protein